MSNAVEKVKRYVGIAGALATVLGIRATIQDDGRIGRVSALGVLPLFFRDKQGRARILGFRAKRLD